MIKNPPASAGDIRDAGSIPGSGRSPGGGHGSPLVFLPGESHGQRSLVGYSPRGCKEADTTEALPTQAELPSAVNTPVTKLRIKWVLLLVLLVISSKSWNMLVFEIRKETLSKLKLLIPVLFGSWVIRMWVSDIFTSHDKQWLILRFKNKGFGFLFSLDLWTEISCKQFLSYLS